MDLIQSSKHISNSKVKIMWTYSSTLFLPVCKKESDSLLSQRIKTEDNNCHLQLNNTFTMEKNTLSIKSSSIVHISQINKVISTSPPHSSTDTLISLLKSLWTKTKSSKLLTTNTFYLSIQLNLKQILTSLKKFCTFLSY